MPISSPSTELYAVGKGILSIGIWNGSTPPGTYTDVGNCPALTAEVTEEVIEHFSSRSGTRKKDKIAVIETGYTIAFDLDEMSAFNLQMYLKGELVGNVIRANKQLDREYAVKFVGDNPLGPNETWEFHRVKLTPSGAVSLISDDWKAMSYTGEGLSDEANNVDSPFFNVVLATTTTTTTTTTA